MLIALYSTSTILQSLAMVNEHFLVNRFVCLRAIMIKREQAVAKLDLKPDSNTL